MMTKTAIFSTSPISFLMVLALLAAAPAGAQNPGLGERVTVEYANGAFRVLSRTPAGTFN
jgi:hypothetical protein